MKNNKRLESINKKIADLQKAKTQLENDFVKDISKETAKIFLKKKAYSIEKSVLLKGIESVIDAIENHG